MESRENLRPVVFDRLPEHEVYGELSDFREEIKTMLNVQNNILESETTQEIRKTVLRHDGTLISAIYRQIDGSGEDEINLLVQSPVDAVGFDVWETYLLRSEKSTYSRSRVLARERNTPQITHSETYCKKIEPDDIKDIKDIIYELKNYQTGSFQE